MEEKTINPKLILAAIAAAVVVMATAIFPFWNLIPKDVTENVKIVSVDSSGCMAETLDKFLVKVNPCNVKVGDIVQATFDGKIKDRERALSP